MKNFVLVQNCTRAISHKTDFFFTKRSYCNYKVSQLKLQILVMSLLEVLPLFGVEFFLFPTPYRNSDNKIIFLINLIYLLKSIILFVNFMFWCKKAMSWNPQSQILISFILLISLVKFLPSFKPELSYSCNRQYYLNLQCLTPYDEVFLGLLTVLQIFTFSVILTYIPK